MTARVLARRFELVRQLGQGGMAEVYDAVDQATRARVALKLLRSIDGASRARFKREFRAMQDVHHPNLVRLHELHEDGDLLCFTMDLIDGVDFLVYVRGGAIEHDGPDTLPLAGPQPPAGAAPRRPAAARLACDEARLRDALAQLVRAVTALHDHALVHRDIKPSNILVTPAGELRLLDFGLISDPSLHQSTEQHVVGTAGYMAPEQAGDGAAGPHVDWYSVGVVLFEALTGCLPFAGAPLDVIVHKRLYDAPAPSALVFDVPPDLDRLCEWLLSRDPAQRPDGHQLAAALERHPPARPAEPAVRSRRVPGTFVGRAAERRWLRARYELVGDAGPLAVWVEGESGIGKTAVVHQLIDDLRDDELGLVVLRGRCYERESVAYKGIDGIIESLHGFLRRLPARDAAALAPRHAGALTLQFPILAEIPALATGAASARLQPPQVARTQVIHALRELLLRLTDRYRLVIWLDDVQWMDADGRLVLDALVRDPEAPPALLVVTRTTGAHHDREVARLPCREDTLVLGPLTDDDAGALVVASAQRAGVAVDAALARALVEQAHGHPILLLELVLHVARRGGPARVGPVYIDDVLWERVAALAPAPRALLELVAVAGSPLPLGVAAAAAELDAGGALGWVAQLRGERLVSTRGASDGVTLQLAHDRVHRVVLRHLGEARVADRHAAIARALERMGSDDAERLATHWAAAGDVVRAAPHAARAAAAAERAFAFDRAVALFRLASAGTADPIARFQLRVAEGEALTNAGRGPEAARVFLACAATPPPADTALALRHRAADQFLRSGHIDEGIAELQELLRAVRVRLPRTPRAALASLIYHRARLALRGLRYVERAEQDVPPAVLRRVDVCGSVASGLSLVDMVRSADFQARHLLLALDAGEPRRLSIALATEACFASSEGGRGRQRVAPLLDQARALAHRSGHPHALGRLALSQGVIAMQEGRFAECLRFARDAAHTFRDRSHGTAWELTSARVFSIWAQVSLGRLRELAAELPDMVRDCRDRGDRLGLVSLTSGPIHVLGLARDDARQMRAACEDGLSRWAQSGFHFQHLCALFTLVAADLYEGHADAAVAHLEATWPAVERSLLLRVQFFRLDLWALRGRVALAAARGDARSIHVRRIEQAIAGIERERMAWASGHALALRAGLAQLGGDRPLAGELVERAERAFAAAEMAVHAAACQLQRGVLLDDAGALARGSTQLADQGVLRPRQFATTLLPVTAWTADPRARVAHAGCAG
jgi:eukaryotic-like serine/threonine-protein kinase